MELSRDVILDLMPLYLAGEASPATRLLVDEFLSKDPELARMVTEQRGPMFEAVGKSELRDQDLSALHRTRQRLSQQRWLFGLGWFFLALASSFEFTNRGSRIIEFHFLARDHPLLGGACLVLGVACWAAYARLRQRLTVR
jgi:anti-sigma factor RsiW